MVADGAELDWRYIIYLAAIVLLAYSFFPMTQRRWLIILGLLVSVGVALALALLLRNGRPTFAYYAGTITLALLLVRLIVPPLWAWTVQHTARWLFVLALAVGVLLVAPELQSSDDAFKYMTAESVLVRHTLQLSAPQLDTNSVYSRYALGHSLAELPLLAASLGWQALTDAPPAVHYMFVTLLDPLATACAVLLLFLCARRFFGERLALVLSMVYLFATFTLPYATQSWSEPLISALLLLAFYAMVRVFDAAEAHPQVWRFVAGLAMGYMLFTKNEYILTAIVFVVWWLARRISELRQLRVGAARLTILLREWLPFALPIACCGILAAAYNYVSAGTIAGSYVHSGFNQFNTPVWLGLYGLLLSPGKGLFWYAPPAIVAVFALPRFWRRHNWGAALIAVLFVLALLFYATYEFWDAGLSWGPRYLLPYVSLLILVSGAALQSWQGWRRWQRGGYLVMILLGAIAAFAGALTNPSDSWWYGYDDRGKPNWTPVVEFDPLHSPILNALRLVWHGYLQSQSSTQLSYYHFPAFFDQLVPALLIAIAVIAATQVGRNCFAPTVPAAESAGRAMARPDGDGVLSHPTAMSMALACLS